MKPFGYPDGSMELGRRRFALGVLSSAATGYALGASMPKFFTGNYRAILPHDYQEYISPGSEEIAGLADDLEIHGSGDHGFMSFELGPGDFMYDSDRGRDWQHPVEYLENDLEGDCEDYALLIQSILEADDRPSVLVVAETGPNDLHAYVETFHDGEYLATDVNFPANLYSREGFEEMFGEEVNPVGMFSSRLRYQSFDPDWAEKQLENG